MKTIVSMVNLHSHAALYGLNHHKGNLTFALSMPRAVGKLDKDLLLSTEEIIVEALFINSFEVDLTASSLSDFPFFAEVHVSDSGRNYINNELYCSASVI